MEKLNLDNTDDQHLLALIYSMSEELIRRSDGKITLTDIAQDLIYIDKMRDKEDAD